MPAPLAWPDIHQRALAFAHDWKDETREHAEAQTFWNEFFHVFGLSRRKVAEFERNVSKHAPTLATGTGLVQEPAVALGRGRIDLFWPGLLLGESKSRHRNLDDLYDPLAMPPDLRAAHRTLDARVERLYRAKKFGHDTERVQHLFECYAVLSAPLALAPAATPRRQPHPLAPSPKKRGN